MPVRRRTHHSRTRTTRASSSIELSAQTVSRRFMKTRGFVIVLLAMVIALSISVVREGVRRVHIGREIRVMEERIAQQEQKNLEMQALTKILNTSAAEEKQSRLTLNTVSPGEQVVILKQSNNGSAANSIVLPTGENIDTVPVQGSSNVKKWIHYFFNN